MTDFERLRATLPTGLWIDGAQTDPIDGGTFPIYDPATGTLNLSRCARSPGQYQRRVVQEPNLISAAASCGTAKNDATISCSPYPSAPTLANWPGRHQTCAAETTPAPTACPRR